MLGKSSKIDLQYKGGRRGRDRMVVGFTTTYEITFKGDMLTKN